MIGIERTMADNFCKSIKRLRLEQGMTQKELAKKSGVTAASICYWESHVRYPTIDNAFAVSNALGVSVTEMAS